MHGLPSAHVTQMRVFQPSSLRQLSVSHLSALCDGERMSRENCEAKRVRRWKILLSVSSWFGDAMLVVDLGPDS